MAAMASATPVSHKQPALRVLDQVAVVDEVHRLADIDARRPARDVARDAFAAIEDVELFDPGFGCAKAVRAEIASAATARILRNANFLTRARPRCQQPRPTSPTERTLPRCACRTELMANLQDAPPYLATCA